MLENVEHLGQGGKGRSELVNGCQVHKVQLYH